MQNGNAFNGSEWLKRRAHNIDGNNTEHAWNTQQLATNTYFK